jgi:hypothetical protein
MRIVLLEEDAYVAEVMRRFEASSPVPGYPFAKALPAECHANAEGFTRFESQSEIVRGWLVVGIGGAEGHYRIVAHSVNRRAGALIDVAPLSDADHAAYHFVKHWRPEEEFQRLRQKFLELYFPIIQLSFEQMNALHFSSLRD